jgi:hypothetical protein
MVDWTRIIILAAGAGLVLFVGWAMFQSAMRTARETQALKDKLAGEKTKAEIVEKSNEAAQAADARSASDSQRVAPDIVQGSNLPDWTKRR